MTAPTARSGSRQSMLVLAWEDRDEEEKKEKERQRKGKRKRKRKGKGKRKKFSKLSILQIFFYNSTVNYSKVLDKYSKNSLAK